jgi:hypothetical protein
MCIIAIKKRGINYPSYDRVKAMCENNNDGFSIVWHVKGQPVRNYRTLNEGKFLKKYKEITSAHKAKDVSLFIHARIKTHGTQKLENCHGWINDKIGLAFAHNGILTIKNRDDMTDSETFFLDIFSPIFEIGGWEAGKLAINACIGSSKFCFMDLHGDIIHFGHYISGDDGILYSNESYMKRASYCDVVSAYPRLTRKYTPKNTETGKRQYYDDDFDVWEHNFDYWKDK